jgi:hypothetical protein
MSEADGDVVAGALAVACRDPAVLAKLAGPLGAAVRATAGQIDRASARHVARRARTAVPAGVRGVHASWIEAALDGAPVRARAALAAAEGDAVDVWIARWVTAAFPPMPAITASRVTSLDSAMRVDAATLAAWLEDAGADQLALALAVVGGSAGGGGGGGAGSADGEFARAAARIGERLHAAAARIAIAPRAGALGPRRAVIARCRIELDDLALLRIGARAVAPHLDPLARLRIRYRLPRALGRIVTVELAGGASAALADAPRWSALVAPR